MKTFRQLSGGLAMAVLFLVTFTTVPSQAQNSRVNQRALEHAKWNEAPREMQIIDDRPVLRDFREAPAEAGSIELPPGPQGSGGGAGGGGGGALGGGAPSLPSGGMHLGGPNQGFREAPGRAGLPLPKSGFGGTNIPARGMAPKGLLPSGSSTNSLMGKMLPQAPAQGAGAGAPRGIGPTASRTNGNYNGPAVQTYSGGSGSGYGSGYGGSASRTEENLRGRLLRH